MRLRQKTLLWTGTTLIVALAALFVIARREALQQARALEEERVLSRVLGAAQILRYASIGLQQINQDWSNWDDAYQYALDRNQGFADANLTADTFEVADIDAILFLNAQNEVLYEGQRDVETADVSILPTELLAQLKRKGAELLKADASPGCSGLLAAGDAIWVIAGHHLLTSRKEGPSRGLLFFGRRIDPGTLEELGLVVQQEFSLRIRGAKEDLARGYHVADAANSWLVGARCRPLSRATVSGEGLLKDVFGDPAFLLELDMPRLIYAQGLRTAQLFLWVFLLAGVLLLWVVWVLLSRMVLNPLGSLSQQVAAVADAPMQLTRLRPAGPQEFSGLAGAINRLLAAIERSRDELRKSELMYRAIVEEQTELICRLRPDGVITFVNDAFCRFFNLRREQVLGTAWQMPFPSDDGHPVALARQALSRAHPVFTLQHRVMLENRDLRWLHRTERAVFDPQGGLQEILLVARDISELKQAENDLRLLAAAIEQAAEGIFITDAAGAIRYANPACESMTGFSRAELLGAKPSILKSGEHDRTFYDQLWETITRGEVWRGRMTNRRKDGHTYLKDTAISPVKDSQGNIINYVSVSRDISREVDMEARLRQAQKMEALGMLAGGIAHDFNNILQVIFGYVNLAAGEVAADSTAMGHIREIQQAGHRARDLVRHILAFSRQTAPEKKPVKVQDVAREVLRMLRKTLPPHVEVVGRLDDQVGLVWADASCLHQVLMNLCTNAYHAMREKGGLLEVRMEQQAVGLAAPGISPELKPGDYVVVAVKDTGIGMDSHVRQHIFEPFFTTKKPGEGTGLGLATALGIVVAHDGAMAIDTEPGKGSEFRVYLPRYAGPEEATQAVVTEAGRMPHGSERILLVDDEDAITRFMKTMLERLGYKVTLCSNGVDALALFEKTPGNFDLVITDQNMPAMLGSDLAGRLLRQRPGLPIILCTGFSETTSEEKARAIGVRAFVMKPIVARDLTQTIRRVLDDAAPKS